MKIDVVFENASDEDVNCEIGRSMQLLKGPLHRKIYVICVYCSSRGREQTTAHLFDATF